jgi:hypothetical protein
MGRLAWDPFGDALVVPVPVRERRRGEERDFAILATRPPLLDLLLSASAWWRWQWWRWSSSREAKE